MNDRRSDEHGARLREAFSRAAPAHFSWQTRGAYVAEQEQALVRSAFLPLGRRVLDLGCGEGATLHHLGEPVGAVGVDLFEEKVAFARTALPRCHFSMASGLALPFRDASFDQVLVRDVIHHLENPQALVAECRRVLAPGGRLEVLEPCGRNPLVAAHALSVPAERGELHSSERFLRGLLEPTFAVEKVTRYQPLPIHRLIFHPELGRPALADRALTRAAVKTLERVAGVLLPRGLWAYLHLRAYRLPA